MPIILIRGSGDVGSAVAHTLFKEDYAVLIHDSTKPGVTRRKMSFCDAIFDGKASLDGVNARLLNDISELTASLTSHDLVPLTTTELSGILTALKPGVLVDARMRKHEQPEVQITLAPFTIGLGPNFIAGETVHAAIETGWSEELGRVLWHGATRPLEGEPQTIAGHARDRYVYSPAAGIFHTTLQLGDTVSAGQEVARVDELPLHASRAPELRAAMDRNGLCLWLAEPDQNRRIPESAAGATIVRSLAPWILDYRADASDQGFPCDLPVRQKYSAEPQMNGMGIIVCHG